MAASIIMDMMQRTLVKEGEKEVQDIFRGKRVERIMVGSEVAVVSTGRWWWLHWGKWRG